MPNRARSNRLAAVAMNSMAQQAVPNGMGQSELERAQLVRKSSRVVTQLGDTAETWVTSSSRLAGREDWSIPLQCSTLPDVDVPHRKDEDEDEHLDDQESRRSR